MHLSGAFAFAWPVAGVFSCGLCIVCSSCGSRSEIFGLASAAGDAGVDAAPEAAPPLPPSCTSDSDCVTGAYCLVGSCDTDGGCVTGPRNCDDGVSCTQDTCSETNKACVHSPEDALCPATELCSPIHDCGAFVYGVGFDNHLYETSVPSGQTFDVGLPAPLITEVALAGTGVLYATESYNLYRVDRATAAYTTVAPIIPLHQYNGLGAAADGSLLATSDAASLFRVDPTTGASAPIALLPTGDKAAGDVTTLGSQWLVPIESSDESTFSLESFDVATLRPTIVGPMNDVCAWGLATLGGVVYILDCNGVISTLDPETGASRQVGQAMGRRFLGAAGR
ncbi:MAG TPA: hypothetical protein VGM06_05250 [Polyangiaceae bacterium]|jgi:hypothetical protein